MAAMPREEESEQVGEPQTEQGGLWAGGGGEVYHIIRECFSSRGGGVTSLFPITDGDSIDIHRVVR